MIHGFINLYKERGFTSNDALNVLKGILKTRKLGHTGTLDPEAEGVLPVCIGKATKLSEFLVAGGKRYVTTLRFGQTTDTQDLSGRVTAAFDYVFREADVRETVASFIGGYEQLTPMYSARKVQGRKLYELARQGLETERPRVWVDIESIQILAMDPQGMTLEVGCGKGTYIRALVQDIGEKLGYGAYMTALKRTQVGPFQDTASYTLPALEQLAARGELDEAILPLDYLLQPMPVLKMKPADDKYLLNGNPLTLKVCHEAAAGELFRLETSAGTLAALYQIKEQRNEEEYFFLPYRMLI